MPSTKVRCSVSSDAIDEKGSNCGSDSGLDWRKSILRLFIISSRRVLLILQGFLKLFPALRNGFIDCWIISDSDQPFFPHISRLASDQRSDSLQELSRCINYYAHVQFQIALGNVPALQIANREFAANSKRSTNYVRAGPGLQLPNMSRRPLTRAAALGVAQVRFRPQMRQPVRKLMNPYSDLSLRAEGITYIYLAILPSCSNGSAYQIRDRAAMRDCLYSD